MQVDVTRHNFDSMLPVVQQALSSCTFLSIDCEMTGLHQDGYEDEYLDDMETRYTKVASNAQAFLITQFGLSAFRHQPPKDGTDQRDTYVASTFNFYLFPRPNAFGPSRKFLCDSSSIDFLSNQGFNFNKFVADGISFMPWRQYEKELKQMDQEERNEQKGGNGRAPVVPTKPGDIRFVNNLVAEVTSWVAAGPQGSPTLALEAANNGYLRLLAHQELSRPQFGAQPPGHTGFYVGKVPNSRWPVLQLVRSTPEEAEVLRAADRAARRDALGAAAGFTRVLELARQCGRPVVGHNCLLDVVFSLATFAQVPLPASWTGFKALVGRWFPGGLYDTKYVARQMSPQLFGDTSLGSLYTGLTQEDSPVAAAVRTYLASSGLPAASVALPHVVHGPGCEKYVEVEAGALAHEAGYDAFMTGTVLVHLLPLLQAKAALAAAREAEAGAPPGLDGGRVSPVHFAGVGGTWAPAPLVPVQHLMGRLNLMRTDMAYVALYGADPPLERPCVFYVTGLAPGTTGQYVMRRFADAGLGKVRVASAGSRAFFVDVGPSVAPLVVERMRAAVPPHGEAAPLVMSYAESIAWRQSESLIEAGIPTSSVKRPRSEVEVPKVASLVERLRDACVLM